MYYDQYFPFYVVSMKPCVLEDENLQEKEFQLMKSYYPKMAHIIQEKVEETCECMDYEGSRIYDEYPDKFMLYHTCRKIRKDLESEIQAQGVSECFLDELIQIILYHEIGRRRNCRHRCRKFF